MSELALLKKQARTAAAARREEAHRRHGDTAALALARHRLPIGPPGAVSGFHPYRSEIDTRPLLARLASEGWITALPVIVAKGEPLIFRKWAPGDALVQGHWEIAIPGEGSEEVTPSLLLTPMLAFDARGYRLGYGGGFYDRTIARLRSLQPVVAIGVAYADQEIEAVPAGGRDQPLDGILTERGYRPVERR